jgi:hypothetical protein
MGQPGETYLFLPIAGVHGFDVPAASDEPQRRQEGVKPAHKRTGAGMKTRVSGVCGLNPNQTFRPNTARSCRDGLTN